MWRWNAKNKVFIISQKFLLKNKRWLGDVGIYRYEHFYSAINGWRSFKNLKSFKIDRKPERNEVWKRGSFTYEWKSLRKFKRWKPCLGCFKRFVTYANSGILGWHVLIFRMLFASKFRKVVYDGRGDYVSSGTPLVLWKTQDLICRRIQEDCKDTVKQLSGVHLEVEDIASAFGYCKVVFIGGISGPCNIFWQPGEQRA